MYTMANNSYIFSSMGMFADGNGNDLNIFLNKFDRCCAIANKVDGDTPVKGELLMLFLEGRALAALEEYELSQAGVHQTYDTCVRKLKEYFDSTSAREASMTLFEKRKQKINESEEGFILELLRLYSTANPDHTAEVTLLAVKRKFLAGISPTLRSKIFVFCTDPYANNVTRENLLTHCRAARNLLLVEQPNPGTSNSSSTDRVLVTSEENQLSNEGNQLLAAFSNLATDIHEHQANTDTRLEYLEETIASMSGGQSNYNRGRGGRGFRGGNSGNNRGGFQNSGGNRGSFRGGNRGGNRGFRGGYRGGYRGGSRGGRGRGPIRCYNCNGDNHVARDCRAPSEN